jgi:hypothetical protein
MRTTNILNLCLWRVLALLSLIAALAAPMAWAQNHDTAARAGLQNLTFARHVDTPFTAATATTAMTNASTVVGRCDSRVDTTQDVACQVTMAITGAIGTFGTTGDGGDIADADALITCCNGTADVLVVTAITLCGGSGPAPGFTIIGCGSVGGHGIVSVNSLPGNQLGVEITHEFLHNQGRRHRGQAGEAAMTPGAILNPVLTLTSNIINQVECGNLHTGATFTAADNGPIVDPPVVITCPAPVTAECTTKSPSGTPKTTAPIPTFLAGATATHPDAFGGLCEPTPTLTNNGPAFFPKGATPVTFTATEVDFQNLSSTCQANVTVVDTTAPSITCPAPIAVECTQSGGTPASNPAITAFLAGASATDICDPSPTITNSAPAFFPLGTTGVAFRARDVDLNVGLCSANVTVGDTTPPVISCNTPATITPPDAPITFTATATDVCAPNPPVAITGFTCFTTNGSGKVIDKTESCFVQIQGPSIRIEDSGGVNDTIQWTVRSTDANGNTAVKTCSVTTVHP